MIEITLDPKTGFYKMRGQVGNWSYVVMLPPDYKETYSNDKLGWLENQMLRNLTQQHKARPNG